jgi:cytochrome c oxidase subunit 2
MFDNFPILPPSASSLADDVDALYWGWIAVSAFFSVLIAALVVYFFVRYRRRHQDEMGAPDRASLVLEVGWSIVPLIICLVMFAWGTKVFFDLSRPPADAVEYFATGKQWMWKFQHPTGKREINDLHVPVGRPIKMTMISEDTIHSMYIPAFRVKQDVLPGRYTTIWFEATQVGEYHLFCAEYCGTEHSLMGGTVTVLSQADYEEWLTQGPEETGDLDGEALFASLACETCHRAGARQRGPQLEGVFGTAQPLTGGGSVIADETYIRESILNPQAKVVAGYDPIMPTYQGQVTEDQILQLIDYVKELGAVSATGARAPATSAAPPAAPSEVETEDVDEAPAVEGDASR